MICKSIIYNTGRRWRFRNTDSNSSTESTESNVWNTGVQEVNTRHYDNLNGCFVSNAASDFWSCDRAFIAIKRGAKEEKVDVLAEANSTTCQTNCCNNDAKHLQSAVSRLSLVFLYYNVGEKSSF
jgi:archaellum component FlaF (FlaF/FlaG flagellin family)